MDRSALEICDVMYCILSPGMQCPMKAAEVRLTASACSWLEKLRLLRVGTCRCGYNRTIYPHTLPLEHALRETVNGLWGILSNDYEEKGEAGIYKKKLFLQ